MKEEIIKILNDYQTQRLNSFANFTDFMTYEDVNSRYADKLLFLYEIDRKKYAREMCRKTVESINDCGDNNYTFSIHLPQELNDVAI